MYIIYGLFLLSIIKIKYTIYLDHATDVSFLTKPRLAGKYMVGSTLLYKLIISATLYDCSCVQRDKGLSTQSSPKWLIKKPHCYSWTLVAFHYVVKISQLTVLTVDPNVHTGALFDWFMLSFWPPWTRPVNVLRTRKVWRCLTFKYTRYTLASISKFWLILTLVVIGVIGIRWWFSMLEHYMMYVYRERILSNIMHS